MVTAAHGATVITQPVLLLTIAPALGMWTDSRSPLFGSVVVSLPKSMKPIVHLPLVLLEVSVYRLPNWSLHGRVDDPSLNTGSGLIANGASPAAFAGGVPPAVELVHTTVGAPLTPLGTVNDVFEL